MNPGGGLGALGGLGDLLGLVQRGLGPVGGGLVLVLDLRGRVAGVALGGLGVGAGVADGRRHLVEDLVAALVGRAGAGVGVGRRLAGLLQGHLDGAGLVQVAVHRVHRPLGVLDVDAGLGLLENKSILLAGREAAEALPQRPDLALGLSHGLRLPPGNNR